VIRCPPSGAPLLENHAFHGLPPPEWRRARKLDGEYDDDVIMGLIIAGPPES
jgi:hypothetical protein